MSSRVKRHLSLMELIYKSKPHMRRLIISKASPDFINALCELALNVLKGNVPLSSNQYKQLQKQKSVIRFVADKKVKALKKKKAITQRGGFLLPLLGAAIPFLTSLISRGSL